MRWLVLIAALLPTAAMSQDVAVGEREFNKCKVCHAIVDDKGTVIVKGGKTGPDLWGIVGRKAGAEDGYPYSKALKALGEAGQVWTVEDLAAYVTDPNKFVADKTGDPKLRTKMTFRLRRNQADLAAFLAANSPGVETSATTAP
ncbi:MAG: cytochrome C [Paracoccus denitrificans]|nr:MAG: cytochrome C [Paracoccus denitrificans]PZO84625.1 MAG: cytochrome C [Paracoccus denitrificans]